VGFLLNFKNETDTKNRDIIVSLVKKHLYLTEESFNMFESRMFEPDIDNIYARNIGNDLRFRIDIPENMLHHFDKGWKSFEKYKSYIKKYKITYSDFKSNKIFHKKNTLKIFKFLMQHYLEKKHFEDFYFDYNSFDSNNEYHIKEAKRWFEFRSEESLLKVIENSIRRDIETIGNYRLPDKANISIVLSLNFADWFLCSTAESWGSCLNLESGGDGMYWTGLPGLIGDKNRAMLYITDGKKKEYLGIEVDKILSRSWILLDKKDEINIVKWYPQKIMKASDINKLSGLDMKFIVKNESFRSKHKVNLLRFKNYCSSFIYQDHTRFEKEYIVAGGSGMYYYDKQNLEEGGVFGNCKSFRSIVKFNKTVGDYPYDTRYCCICEDEVNDDDIHYSPNGDSYCPDCFYENYFYCESCDEIFSISFVHGIGHETLCSMCYDNEYFTCNECGEATPKNEGKEYQNKFLCEKCYEEAKEEEEFDKKE